MPRPSLQQPANYPPRPALGKALEVHLSRLVSWFPATMFPNLAGRCDITSQPHTPLNKLFLGSLGKHFLLFFWTKCKRLKLSTQRLFGVTVAVNLRLFFNCHLKTKKPSFQGLAFAFSCPSSSAHWETIFFNVVRAITTWFFVVVLFCF